MIEVGSGYSTAVLLDTRERAGLDIDIVRIEPDPERLLGLMKRGDDVTLIQHAVQDVDTHVFATLEAGDVLFIDWSHVAKAGSDVLWLLLQVLPALAPGVLVHVHDVLWPFEYPGSCLREGRDWNEAYFLHAFLAYNRAREMLLFSSWVWSTHPNVIPTAFHEPPPGGLWMRRVP